MRTHARVALAACAAVLAVGMTACGGDDGGDESAADTTTTSTESSESETTTDVDSSDTSAPLTPEEQAIAAYRAAYDAYFAALNPPNPQSGDLLSGFSGEALTTMVDTVFRAESEGVTVEGSFEMHPEAVSTTESEVVLADCVVETNTVYDAATGEERDSGRYVHNRRATVVNIEGTWTVSEFEHLEESCTPEGE